MHVGLAVNIHEPLSVTLERSLAVDKSGVDSLWIVDFPGSRFAPPVAARIAAETKARIGIGLLSPLLYKSEYLVQVVETLATEYGDRFDLLIGAGDRQALLQVGIASWNPKDVVEQVTNAVIQVKDSLSEKGFRCNVLMGAQGPKMVRASRAADGVLLNLTEPKMIQWATLLLEDRPKNFSLGAFIPAMITNEPNKKSLKEFLYSAAIVALGAPKELLKEFGIYESVREARSLFREKGILDGDVLSLSDTSIISKFGLHGSVETCLQYIRDAEQIGLDNLVLGPPASNRIQDVEALLGLLKI